MKREKTACSCRNITYGMIMDAVERGAESYEQVKERLRCGTGCGKCEEFIRCLVGELLEKRNKAQ